MKKILSFLLSAVACGAMFTATASAANVVVDIDKTEVAIGDVVTVELSVGDISAATFATGVQFDTTLFECVDLYGPEGKEADQIDKEWFYLIDKDARRNPETDADPAPSIDNANSKGVISALWSSSDDVNYAGGIIFTAELKAKDVVKDTDAVISWFEELDCIADDNNDVSLDPVDTETITIKAPVVEDEPTWNAADAAWTAPAGKKAIWWGFKFEDGSFGGHQFITVTDGADAPTTKTVGVGAAEDFAIDGDVEFAVAVILDEDVDAAKFDAYVGR